MCTFERRRSFTTASIVEPLRDQLLRTADAKRVEIIAYCFMPDHLHVLVAGLAPDADANRFLRVFRQRSSYEHARAHGRRLWQEGYFDRHLRTEEATFDVVSYIVNNPVRARLCEAPDEYPYSGSSRYELREIVRVVHWPPGSLG